jgi:cytochrome P450
MYMSAAFGQGPNGSSLIQSLPAYATSPALQYLAKMTFVMDPPDHTRIRRLVARPFQSSRVQALEPVAAKLANELLDGAEKSAEPDLVTDYAEYIPISVISEYLGVPLADRNQNLQWVHDYHLAVGPVVTEEGMVIADAAAKQLGDYLSEVVDERRARPQDDLISALVAEEADGDRLSQTELVTLCFQLLIGGTETTIGAIGLSLSALLDHPEQLDAARRTGGVDAAAVEELLRYEPPALVDVARVALRDTSLESVRIDAGSTVLPMIAAANRDPEHFPSPHTLDLSRRDVKHLTLGKGIHLCLGQALARMELRVAVNAVITRYPALERSGPVVLRGSSMFRAAEHLPVALWR